jgi:hypothetical protein
MVALVLGRCRYQEVSGWGHCLLARVVTPLRLLRRHLRALCEETPLVFLALAAPLLHQQPPRFQQRLHLRALGVHAVELLGQGGLRAIAITLNYCCTS